MMNMTYVSEKALGKKLLINKIKILLVCSMDSNHGIVWIFVSNNII